MKKLFIILLMSGISSFTASAVSWKFYGASFSAHLKVIKSNTNIFPDSGTVELGSRQYVRVMQYGSYHSGDKMSLTIEHINPNGTLSDKDTLIRIQYDLWWSALPFEPDMCKKVYFNIPDKYKTGKFQVTWHGYTTDVTQGYISDNTTGIEDEHLANENIASVAYFDLNGHQKETPEPMSGVLIQRIVYVDGRVRSRKVFFL
jgi:hypothetical protein